MSKLMLYHPPGKSEGNKSPLPSWIGLGNFPLPTAVRWSPIGGHFIFSFIIIILIIRMGRERGALGVQVFINIKYFNFSGERYISFHKDRIG